MSSQSLSAFKTVLREQPASIRRLAQAAGLSESLLVRIRDGERTLTPKTVAAVVEALREWGDRCHALADSLEESADPL